MGEEHKDRMPIVYYSNGERVGTIGEIRDIRLDPEDVEAPGKEAQEAMDELWKMIELKSAEIKGFDKALLMFWPKRILKSGNRTIVFWADDTKTIVKRSEDELDNDYAAFTAALAIKAYGSNSKLKKLIAKKTEYQKVKNLESV